MQLDLEDTKLVAGTAIQPGDNGQYVTSYTVSYSLTGKEGEWTDVPGTFNGNERGITQNTFSAPLLARYVKLHPKTAVEHMSMRADALLCVPFIANTPEDKRIYSTVYNNEEPGIGHARSAINGPQAWTAGLQNQDQWLRLDLGNPRLVAGTVIQPRDWDNPVQYVTSYTVSYSLTGEEGDWTDVPGTFTGQEADGLYEGIFPVAILARYVRLHPKTWQAYVAMRADALVVAGTLAIMDITTSVTSCICLRTL